MSDRNGVPRVAYVHIGAPKTGTTYIQQILHANRAALADAGVLYTADTPDEHFQAAVDLRGLPWGGREHPEWLGAWELLAGRAREWQGTSVISNELLAAAGTDQVRRAVDSLGGGEVHVIYTLRDLARMLRSDWQEQVKHRHSVGWEDYLHEVIDRGTSSDLGSWFWGLHDGPRVLDRWSSAVPADRIHVICLPRAPSALEALWEEFATVIGLPPRRYDLGSEPANLSLGAVETEFLQQVNRRAAAFVDERSYGGLVGDLLIHGALAGRRSPARARFPARHRAWVRERSDQAAAELVRSGYHIVGDPRDLSPSPSSEDEDDGDVPVGAVYDLGADVAARLLRRIGELQGELAELRDVVARHGPPVAEPPPEQDPSAGGRVKRWIRTTSERRPSVMVSRRLWWRAAHVIRSLRR